MKPDGSLLHNTTKAAALSTVSASPAAVAAGYPDLYTFARDAYSSQAACIPFDMSAAAGHKPGYYATHEAWQHDFRAVLEEMTRRHCSMLYAASKYERVRSCGDTLVHAVGGQSARSTVALAFRCGLPLCPCCEASRSHKRLIDLSDALLWLQVQRAKEGKVPLVVLMLTETLPNCTGDQLSAYIDLLFAAHDRLMKYKAVRSVVLGTARSFEVTHKRDDDYHPHLHTLLLVEQSYFNNKTASRGYLSQREWANLHYKAVKSACKSCGVAWSDIQQPEGQTFAVDVRRAYKKGAKASEKLFDAMTDAGREAAKYVCKPDELMRYFEDGSIDFDWSCKAVEMVSCAIKGRRRYTSSGLWREALTACGLDADTASDDDIGQAVNIPRDERKPDASGVAYVVISQFFDAIQRDYFNNSVFVTDNPDDLGPLDGVSALARRAASNLAKRERRQRQRDARQAILSAPDGWTELGIADGWTVGDFEE